jgi:hypothetical protein
MVRARRASGNHSFDRRLAGSARTQTGHPTTGIGARHETGTAGIVVRRIAVWAIIDRQAVKQGRFGVDTEPNRDVSSITRSRTFNAQLSAA